ncbi:MAG: hypothetical protein WCJ64_02040 [Rhodospirillaceae bacterium]
MKAVFRPPFEIEESVSVMTRDEIDRTRRRRGHGRDEQAAQLAMVRGLRRGLRSGGRQKRTLTPGKLVAKAAGGRPQSGRVGKHEGRPTRSFHMSTQTIQVGGDAGGYMKYICREGEFKQRDDLLYISGDIERTNQAVAEIDRTAKWRKGRTAEQIARKIVHELPYDCTPEQAREIADREVEHWKEKGFEAVAAVHGADDDHSKPHVHVLVAGRRTSVRPDGTIAVLREGRDVPMPYTRSKKDHREFLCNTINDICNPAIRFWPKRDAEMDEPGIKGRPPRHRVPEWRWHRDGDKDIDPAKAARLAKKREKIQAEQAAKKPERDAKKAAREAKAAEKRAKTFREFKLPNEAQKKMIAVAAYKAGIELPKDWRKTLDGGDLMAAVKAAERGDKDRCYVLLAEAKKRAELLAPAVAPLLAELAEARRALAEAQTTPTPEPAAPAPAQQEARDERDGSDRSVPGPGRTDGRAGGRGRPATASKSDSRGNRRVPPPHLRNRLRHLSDGALVLGGERLAVLLPQHVPDHLEDQPARQHHAVRRDGRRADVAAALRDAVGRVTAADAVAVGDAIAEGARWRQGTEEAQRAFQERLEWQEATAEALTAGERWQLSARLAQAAETAGADMLARRAWTDGLEQLAGLDSTAITALTVRLHQEQTRRTQNVARKTHRPNRVEEREDRSGKECPADRSDDTRNLEEYREAAEVGRPEPNGNSSLGDGRLPHPDQPRSGAPGADASINNVRPSEKQMAGAGAVERYTLKKTTLQNHFRIVEDKKWIAHLHPVRRHHIISPCFGIEMNAGPLLPYAGASIDVNRPLDAQIDALFANNTKMKPPSPPVEALAPKVVPAPAPPPPTPTEAKMAKPAPAPKAPSPIDAMNAEIKEILATEEDIRRAWWDIDTLLMQQVDQAKNGKLAESLELGGRDRYILARDAGLLSKENFARLDERDRERYEIDPPANPSRQKIEQQEAEKYGAFERIKAAIEKLKSIPAARDAYEAGLRLGEALREMFIGAAKGAMGGSDKQAGSADKRHPDNKHHDEITEADFKRLVQEERERRMKDPAVYFHRDPPEVDVRKRLEERRRELEAKNGTPPIIIIMQQQQAEDLSGRIGRVSDPGRLHGLAAHLRTVGDDVTYPATKSADLISPDMMKAMASMVERLVEQELARHGVRQQSAQQAAPSAQAAQAQELPKYIEWPPTTYSNYESRRARLMEQMKNASPDEIEKMRDGTKKAIAEYKAKGIERPVYGPAIENGLRKIEGVMVERGLLSVDQSAEGRLRAEQERRRQQQQTRRGGGRVD